MKLFPRTPTLLALLALLSFVAAPAWGQENKKEPVAAKAKKAPPADDGKPQAPAVLPGNGLMRGDFMYVEQYGTNIYIVRKGKVVWEYKVPGARGAMQDTTMLSNGNILFANMVGVTEINQNKEIVWHYDAPANPRTEIHTAKAIGKDRVMFIQNGNPARVFLMNKVTGKTELEFDLPVGIPTEAHMQSRRAWLTDVGTVVVAQTDLNKVCEYDGTGKQIWSAAVGHPYSVQRLKNGNTVVSSFDTFVRELGRNGETIWELTPKDLPGYVPGKWSIATRLGNGNTLVTNYATWAGKRDESEAPVQAFEVNPAKQVVWALRSWKTFGPAQTIQFLDEPGVPENQHFANFK